MEGWAGHKLATKLKLQKNKIKEWAKTNFGDVRIQKSNIPAEIQALDKEEVRGQLSLEEGKKRFALKEKFYRKLREKEIKWRQRSRCNWLEVIKTQDFSMGWHPREEG